MKRTNLVLDERLLHEAVLLLKAKTYSEAVNRALAEAVALAKAKGILDFVGKDIWQGDLKEMRQLRAGESVVDEHSGTSTGSKKRGKKVSSRTG